MAISAKDVKYRVLYEHRDSGFYVLIHIEDLIIEKGPYQRESYHPAYLSAEVEAENALIFLDKLLEY